MLIHKILRRLPPVFHGLAERFDDRPIDSPDKAGHFVRTRSSYIAQTALFSYLKARMGTNYRNLFEDKKFSSAIRIASSATFASCLSDLTIFCVALIARDGGLTNDQATALADLMYRHGYKSGLESVNKKERPKQALSVWQTRLEGIDWDEAAENFDLFQSSADDLMRFAPVIDEFKEQDTENIQNNIHLRWKDIRNQWRKRMVAAAIAEEWRDRDAA